MPNVSTGLKSLPIALGICATAAMPHATQAAIWIGNTDANVGTVANWDETIEANETLFFGGAGTSGTSLNWDLGTAVNVTFNSGASAYTFSGGAMGWSGTSSLIQNNSASTQTFNNNVSRNGNGTIDAASGELVFDGNVTWAGSGTMTVRGTGGVTFGGTNTGGILTVHSNNNSSTSAFGVLDVTGSTTISATGASQGVFNLGTSGGNGRINIELGGSLSALGTTNATKQNSIIGQQSTGELNVNGGELTIGAESGLIIGNGSRAAGLGGGGGVGTLNVNSGTVTINKGTTTTTTNTTDTTVIMIGRDSTTATGTVNLDGGTLATDRQFVRDGSTTGGDGIAYFNFNGGTLKALGDQSDWLRSSTNGAFRDLTAVTVKTGGAIVDSNSFNVAINNVLAHDINVTTDGGLTKKGAGTLTLGGASTYNGATKVDAGTLALGASGSISASAEVEIAAGAVFETLLQSSFAMAGAQPFTFAINGAGAGSAGLLNADGLDISSGAVDFTTLGTLDDSAYIIASYTSLTGSAFANVSNLPSGYSIDYNYLGGNDIALVIPQPASMALLALGGLMMLPRRRGV